MNKLIWFSFILSLTMIAGCHNQKPTTEPVSIPQNNVQEKPKPKRKSLPFFDTYINNSKIELAKAQIKLLHASCNIFKIDTGQYPEELIDLVTKPDNVENWESMGYLDGEKQVPLDPWGNQYTYKYPGEIFKFDIYCITPKGKKISNSDPR